MEENKMTNEPSSRWPAWASMLGGLLLIVYVVLHPQRDPASVLAHAWASIHFLGILAMAFIVTGLLPIYSVQTLRLGRAGGAGFALAFLGSALYIGLLATDAFVNPLLATYAPETVHSAAAVQQQIQTFGFALLLQPLAILLFITGYGMFSIATIRARLLPNWVGVLLFIGAILFGAATLVPILIEQIGGVFFGLGQIGIGYEGLRKLRRRETDQVMSSPTP
jgi:hypothetical protein